jgi:hypothetical protein
VIVLSALMSVAAAAPHNGSSQEATTPPKIHELLKLLADPKIHELLTLIADRKVQEWLEEQGEAKAAAGSAQETANSVEDYLSSRAGAIREQIVALARAIPDLPNQFERAAARYSAVHGEYGRAWALFNLAVFGALGFWRRMAVQEDDGEGSPPSRRAPCGDRQRSPPSRRCALRPSARHGCSLRPRQRRLLPRPRLESGPSRDGLGLSDRLCRHPGRGRHRPFAVGPRS